MFARYYYNLGCCCHTPVWLPARWISCCRVFPFHQAHSTGNVDHSTELHPCQAELQPAGMEDLISLDSLISFILEEGRFISQTNSCKPLCSPHALCLRRDAKDLHVGWGLEGFWSRFLRALHAMPWLGSKNSIGLMLRKCFVWPETGSLWVRASWWSVLSNGLFLQSCPRQYLQERLGWDLAAARRMLALQPLLVCVYSDVSAWHVGTGRVTKRPGCVHCVAVDWTFLPCSVASCLCASCPSSFRGSSDAFTMPWPFPSVGILLPIRFKSEKGGFDLPRVPEVVCSVCWQK